MRKIKRLLKNIYYLSKPDIQQDILATQALPNAQELLNNLLNNLKYEIADEINEIQKQMQKPTALSCEESIVYIVENGVSISRFGDGEIMLMFGEFIPFQAYDSELANRLKQVLVEN